MLKKLLGLTLAICFSVPVLAVPAHSDHSRAQDNVIEIEKLCQHFLKDGCSENELIDLINSAMLTSDESGILDRTLLKSFVKECFTYATLGVVVGLGMGLAIDGACILNGLFLNRKSIF
jgi:hypothetical protein